MKSTHTNCNEIHEIWVEEATGRPLTSSERALVETHLADCRACRLEAEAAAAVRLDGTPGPASDLDDLSHRRWVDDVLARAERAGDRPAARAERQQTGSAPIYRIGFFVAAAAVVALVAGAVIWASIEEHGTSPAQEPIASRPAPTALTGQLLLAAGDVRLDGAPATGAGRLAAGITANVGQGRTVLDLGTGITLLAEERTEIEIAALDTSSIEVRLERGRVMAEVDPARSGPPFAVATRDGRVVVSGTAFAVEADEERALVSVFRGSVRVEDGVHEGRKVRLGEGAILGQPGVSHLTDEDEAAAAEVLHAFDMLSAERATRLDIQSLPADATVVVDGVELGRTPLEVSIRSGHRRLELRLEGYETVRELLELVPGADASRVFDLVGTATQPGDEIAAGPVTVERPDRRARETAAAAETGSAPLGPGDLLERAQAFRVARDWGNAVAAYNELLGQYPGSAQALNSLVSIGDIQLDHLSQPGRALESFDAYLARTRKGTLAQEAAFGRARALRALGRTAEEIRALEAFVAEFPSAIQVDRARRRLEELAGR